MFAAQIAELTRLVGTVEAEAQRLASSGVGDAAMEQAVPDEFLDPLTAQVGRHGRLAPPWVAGLAWP